MSTIAHLHARQILDSRGNPTVEVDCQLDDDSFGRSAVPSGASTGTHEALELRDKEDAYGGKSVLKACEHVNTVIIDSLRGVDITSQEDIDRLLLELDGTDNKANLGANALLGVSMAVCQARAASEQQPLWWSLKQQFDIQDPAVLPVPLMNVINGGKHADSGLSFQECMIVPNGFESFNEALQAGAETFHTLKKILTKEGHITAVGDEGGFAPRVADSKEAFSLLMRAIEDAGYTGKMQLAIDAAASEFYKDGLYTIDGQTLSSKELTMYYQALAADYPLVSIEDSHHEDDWDGFVHMKEVMGDTMQLVGDDLLVTNVGRIEDALEKDAANAVLIKLNQIGTVTETVDAISLGKEHGWKAVVSHRSGETEDTFIAHLAVGIATGQIKTGSLSRSDRTAKYNELLRIEEQLGAQATYAFPFGVVA